MRFIHTADVHLGAVPDSGMPWSRERAEAIQNTFAHIVRLAEKNRVDLLLIAGDLFHRQPLSRELKELNYLFSGLTRTRVVIIAGNHDYIREDSPHANYPWSENVTFLSSETMSSVYFEDINTEVHGFSYHRQEIPEPRYDDCRAPDDGRIHILLAHGGDSRHIPIRMSRLAAAGFDYVALGHIHQPKIYRKSHMAYAGSPEPLDKTDTGPRGCMLGEITDDNFRILWKPLAKTQYRVETITADRDTTQAELADRVGEILTAHPADIYRIVLTGSRDPEITFDRAAIARLGRVVEVTDETVPDYDLDALLRDHSHDLISYYIQALGGKDAGPTERKALYYGLRALLNPE